ncbi:CsbD family protein [Macrococcus armenti]|uniref:CsbD family protein n=1 Tax=Macrococcus armenti TaxID=2875764 RepID=UPI001CCC8E0A|nr:CsbD family protein [Macrococcus armenti]UBH13411.1 CsbD family protein [Macrococcus armenti]UBH22655.1 CsbD family protein [Macrococcus armenti]
MENEGKLEQLKGNVQETVGNAIGDKELENEGKGNKISGKVKEVSEDVQNKVDETIDNFKK